MFGEFTDDEKDPPTVAGHHEPSEGATSSPARGASEPLWRLIAHHLAQHPDVVLKSQQRGEPELSVQEKVAIAVELMERSPSQFLYRFDRYLKAEHLPHFEDAAATDPVLGHYLQQARDKCDIKKAKVLVRNRRWAAVQRLERAAAADSSCTDNSSSSTGSSSSSTGSSYGSIADHREYFTESEMRRRDPLLYHQLVGRHLTDDEKRERKEDFDRADCRITTIIFDHLDRCDERQLKKQQEEIEDDMFEEEEEEEEEEQEAMEEEESDPARLNPTQKALLKEEFVSSMYSKFVTGDEETFDYKCIDENEDYDLLDIEGHDKEEKYFDGEEPCEAMSEHGSSRGSPILPSLCLDRRVKEQLTLQNSSTGTYLEQQRLNSEQQELSQQEDDAMPPAGTVLGSPTQQQTLNIEQQPLSSQLEDDGMPPVESLSIK